MITGAAIFGAWLWALLPLPTPKYVARRHAPVLPTPSVLDDSVTTSARCRRAIADACGPTAHRVWISLREVADCLQPHRRLFKGENLSGFPLWNPFPFGRALGGVFPPHPPFGGDPPRPSLSREGASRERTGWDWTWVLEWDGGRGNPSPFFWIGAEGRRGSAISSAAEPSS